MKFFIWGLGSIGTSFLRIIKENGYFDAESFYCLDSSLDAKNRFLSFDGKEDHFCLDRITEDNIGEYLCVLSQGDYLLDFTIDLKTLDILRYCLEHNVHYLNTADSSWKNDPLWFSVHQHYLEYLKIKDEFKSRQNTCLVEFGMNPGMVSCFVKKCIKEIVKTDETLYLKRHRKELLRLLDEGKYGLVAKKLKVTDVQEVDNDNQEVSIPYEKGICYSHGMFGDIIMKRYRLLRLPVEQRNDFIAIRKSMIVILMTCMWRLSTPDTNIKSRQYLRKEQ